MERWYSDFSSHLLQHNNHSQDLGGVSEQTKGEGRREDEIKKRKVERILLHYLSFVSSEAKASLLRIDFQFEQKLISSLFL